MDAADRGDRACAGRDDVAPESGSERGIAWRREPGCGARLGAEVTYIEVAGGDHVNVVVPNLPKVFEFLAAHRRPKT